MLEVPERLKNIKLRTAGEGTAPKDDEYVYPHNHEGHFVTQEYAPTLTKYYEPTEEGYEATIAKRMAAWDSMRNAKRGGKES